VEKGKGNPLSGRCCPVKVLYPIEGDGGGAVTHVLTLARELRKNVIPTSIVFLTDGPSVSVAAKAGLDFELIQKKFPLDPAPIRRLARLLAKKDVNIIHTHTIRGNFYGRIAASLCQEPIVDITTVHSHVPDELGGGRQFGLKEWLLCKRESCLWRFVDHFICVSNKIRERLLSNGIPEDKVTVIENAAELPELSPGRTYRKSIREEFNIADNDIVVGTIGRLVPLKNHELFLKSAKQLSQRMPNMKFVVVGDGPLLQQLVDKSRGLGISGLVRFTGWRDDIQRLLFAFDIYVICSVVEGLNVSVLEAMACAKPVVGTNVKGISEIVMDGTTGILVPSNEVDSLTEAVLQLAMDEEKRTTMGFGGRRLIEKKYSVDKMVYDTLQVYDKSCSDFKKSTDFLYKGHS
jgi:glycosyltransferase involved in cell wall biosynthesis